MFRNTLLVLMLLAGFTIGVMSGNFAFDGIADLQQKLENCTSQFKSESK